jgi:hypothetical protein
MYWEVGAQLYVFLALVVDGDEGSASCCDRFIPEETDPIAVV